MYIVFVVWPALFVRYSLSINVLTRRPLFSVLCSRNNNNNNNNNNNKNACLHCLCPGLHFSSFLSHSLDFAAVSVFLSPRFRMLARTPTTLTEGFPAFFRCVQQTVGPCLKCGHGSSLPYLSQFITD